MGNNNTDREWERFGATDPYFGVVSHAKYHLANLTPEGADSFFRTGQDYIAHVVERIRKHIDPTCHFRDSLDFGCGVGRLVIPLASYSERVVGVDVSASMLKEAIRNCESRSVMNASFVRIHGDRVSIDGTFDFVHSFIVFQHIPAKRGERIVQDLLAHLKKGGVCVLHFKYAEDGPIARRAASFVKDNIPFSRNLLSFVRGRGFFAPTMQMNSYALDKIFAMMQRIQVRDFYAEFTNHFGHLGVLVYFQRPMETTPESSILDFG
jgi:SAM-dependent methyltransferase